MTLKKTKKAQHLRACKSGRVPKKWACPEDVTAVKYKEGPRSDSLWR